MIVDNRSIAPRFTLTDISATRPDLARRREVKFALPQADATKIRRILTGSCKAVTHNDRVSTVRSVYFDDVKFSAGYANIDGLSNRNKLRIRWYDALQPQCEFYAEIKWRQNRTTGKHRYRVTSDVPLSELSYDQIRKKLIESLPEHHVNYVLRFPDPIVLVEYKRQHFTAKDDDIRLTIDYDLAFYDQVCKRRISTSFRRPMHDFLVLEGKAPCGKEGELKRLLHPFSARATRCSKYVFGCQLLGHISDA